MQAKRACELESASDLEDDDDDDDASEDDDVGGDTLSKCD